MKKAMKESITYIELPKCPVMVSCQRQDDTHSRGFDDWTKGFVIINTGLLMKPLSHKTSFIPRNRAIRIPFDLVNPPTSNHILSWRRRNEGPGLLPLKSFKFRSHSMLPLRDLGSNGVVRRLGLKIGGGGKVKGFLLRDAGLGPGLHGVGGSIGEYGVN